MNDEQDLRETFCELSKARIAPYKNTWKPLQDTVHWWNLLLAQEWGLQFYQTRSNAVVLYDTLPLEFIEKVICMKTKEQLDQRESARPRVVLKANSQWIYKIYPDKKQDHLGKHKAMHRASGKPDATLWITEFHAYPSQQFDSRMNKDNIQLPSWSRSLSHISTRNNFLRCESDAEDQ